MLSISSSRQIVIVRMRSVRLYEVKDNFITTVDDMLDVIIWEAVPV